MRWDFSLEPGPTGSGASSPVEIFGLRIYKTLFDENNNQVAKIETTAKDAYENAEPGFIDEYRQSALTLFSAQLADLFEAREHYAASLPSLAVLFGSNLRSCLTDIVVIANGDDV